MISKVRRLKDLFESRHQSYAGLVRSQSVEETLSWAQSNKLLGFNRSALRLRILYSIASAFQATHFIETGTYHGATTICALQGLALKVWTCEVSRWHSWLSRALVSGLPNIEAVHEDSSMFIENAVNRLLEIGDVRPFFYLDAHAGINEHSCPILKEISQVVRLDSFLAVIDDFEVPNASFRFGTYGKLRLNLDLIRDLLSGAGIRRVVFPSYSPELEAGIARTGYVMFYRSTLLERYVQSQVFPASLLQSLEVADGSSSQTCASS